MLDSGAHTNFISQDFFNKLSLEKHNSNLSVTLATNQVKHFHHCSSIKIKSRVSSFETTLSCLIVLQVTSDLLQNSFDTAHIVLPQDIVLADPTYNITQPIDILIKSSVFWEILKTKRVKLGNNLMASDTQLGWVITGTTYLIKHKLPPSTNIVTTDINTIDDTLKKFWQLENFASDQQIMSIENQQVEAHFAKTVSRNKEGRFVVSIPFKHKELNKLGSSKQIATNRFLSLERKLDKKPEIKPMYVDFINEYKALNHMTEISHDDNNNHLEYYLPHHHVLRELSLTTKLRVVFDGSCKTETNVSLNDNQYAGPNLQTDLFNILIRFRMPKYIVTADIEKMYRQILIDPLQRHFQ